MLDCELRIIVEWNFSANQLISVAVGIEITIKVLRAVKCLSWTLYNILL